MAIKLLDESLEVAVYYDPGDSEFEDNICISFVEDCPQDEKLFRADETNIYLTAAQARQLVMALNNACAARVSAQNKRKAAGGGR